MPGGWVKVFSVISHGQCRAEPGTALSAWGGKQAKGLEGGTMDQRVFTFTSDAVQADTFDVVRFSGHEGLSELYSFDILLLSDKSDINATNVLQANAEFAILPPFAPRGGLKYKGILASFETLGRTGGRYVYRARLRHRLWWLTLVCQNRVFLDKTPKDFLCDVLRAGGLTQGTDFDWQCRKEWPARDFVCQYQESDYAFLCRWLEKLGIYFWFDQRESGACCLFGDSRMVNQPLKGSESCRYVAKSGLNPENPGQVVTDISLFESPLPKEVRLKSYNPEKPSVDLTRTFSVRDNGRGTFYVYGDNYADTREGDALAGVLAEALRANAVRLTGVSHNPGLRPGFVFSLKEHFRSSFNQDYLTTAIDHEGSQARILLQEGAGDLGEADRLFYRNTFSAIPAQTQYRSLRTTPWPSVPGIFPAVVDAEGSGTYAVLDSQGRYKVILPFDLSGRSGGKASGWVRMMQPYAGEGMGFHAPLHKGTEVALGFVGGDPDRPVILGAVPNPRTPSPVNDATAPQIRLDSAGGTKLHFDDTKGSESVNLSVSSGAFIKISN